MKNKKEFFGVLFSVLISVLLVGFAVYATSTIGNDITVGDDLIVTEDVSLTGNEIGFGNGASISNAADAELLTLTETLVSIVGKASVSTSFNVGTFASIGNDLSVEDGDFSVSGDATITGNDLTFGNGAVITNTDADTLTLTELLFDLNGSLDVSNDLIVGTGPLQVAHTASVAYSRFGTGTTGHSLADADDLLITGLLEVDDTAYFDGNASISGNLWVETIYGALSDTYLRIGDGGDSTTSHSFASEDDLLITGNLEVDGTSWFDGKIRAGQFGDPIDVTSARKYGTELHYRGNNYDVVGLRSRASLRDTDASTKSAWGAEIQGANDDGIDASVVQGAVIEGMGKSDTTAATITTLRGAVINTEWAAQDTVTDLRTLHVRTHTMNSDTAGYISNTGYLLYLENEAVGGNGQQLDAGIYLKATNVSTPSAFNYGIDLSGAADEIATADLRLSSSITISTGTASPSADCTAGSLYFRAGSTASESMYICLTANEWDVITGLDLGDI